MDKMLRKDELQNFAKEFIATFVPKAKATVIALSGNLGAGKTTFVQTLGTELGITEVIQSPTYVIMKRYVISKSGFENFYHIDAYRLDDAADLQKLNIAEVLQNPKNLIAIEWPERVQSLIPEDAIKLNFTHINETTRQISRSS